MTIAINSTLLTSITSNWITSTSKERKEPGWLLALRLEAFKNYDALSWPDKRNDQWKRTGLEKLKWNSLHLSSTPPLKLEGEGWTSLEEAITSFPDLVKKAWTDAVARAKTNKFLSLTLALGNGGACLHIPKGKKYKTPFKTCFPETGSLSEIYFSLSFIFVEDGAEIQLWEDLNGSPSVIFSYTHTHLSANAQASFYQIQNWKADTIHVQVQDFKQDASSRLHAIEVAVGGQIYRNETTIFLTGNGAENKILGLSFGDRQQNFENWITQIHAARNTTSDIQHRGALKGESKSFLSGLISITKEGQQSDAYQSAKYLLLSKSAKADAIPNLEILADDVKCAHGAAVGPVDKDQIFYLQTRGIPPEKGEEIIVQGFFDPVIAAIPSENIQEQLRTFIEEKLKSS